MASTLVIVNPLAGRGFGNKAAPKIKQLLSEHGIEWEMAMTTHAREAIELARQAAKDGYQLIVAAGGDGTYQEVINGVMQSGTPATVGILPVGSGSDFSHAVNIPSDLEGACARLATGNVRLVDVGRVTVDEPLDGEPEARYFDNAVGIGFDGVVTEECRRFKRLRGMALYLPAVLKSVFVSLQPARSEITYRTNGAASPVEHIQSTVLMATVCNGPREGGGFMVAPHARPDDGLFDICLAEIVPRLQILSLIPHFMRGTHIDKPNVRMLQSTHIVITSPDSMIAHADGEMLCTAAHRIECEMLPNALRVLC